LKKPKTIFMFR